MLSTVFSTRKATMTDADHLARLINHAGEGLPFYFWQKAATDGTDPWTIGRTRAQRETGSFSYRNAIVAELDGQVAGCLVTYPIADQIGHSDYSDMPPIFVPIQQLEDMAAGTQYVSVLAVYPEFRSRGVGTRLLDLAEDEGRRRTMSIIVPSANIGALRLYQRFGYRRRAKRAMVKEDWNNPGHSWILMLK